MRVSVVLASFCVLALSACSSSSRDQPDDGAQPHLPPDEVVDRGPFDHEHPPPPTDEHPPEPFGEPVHFEPVVRSEVTPPPLSGGTLLLTRDRRYAIAADPDRDAIFIADIVPGVRGLIGEITVPEGSEPGRSIEDGAGRIHTLLRRSGELVSFLPTEPGEATMRYLCAEPRGITWRSEGDLLAVVCAGGEMLTLDAQTRETQKRLHLDLDLRDIIVDGDHYLVSRFRSAELLVVSTEGVIEQRLAPSSTSFEGRTRRGPIAHHFIPNVAWRTAAHPHGGAIMVHQRASDGGLRAAPGGYGDGGSCRSGVVETTVAHMGTDRPPVKTPTVPHSVLPVDVAVSGSGERLAVVSAGSAPFFPSVVVMSTVGATFEVEREDATCVQGEFFLFETGQQTPVAVAFASEELLYVQTRQPARLFNFQFSELGWVSGGEEIALSEIDRTDTGYEVFHRGTFSHLACASCHPEGGDDAHTWNFEDLGPRRTQSFRGGISGTEPLHWAGDMRDLDHLVHDVFGSRMGGGPLSSEHVEALRSFMDSVRDLQVSPPASVAAEAAIARGQALFEGEAACDVCHNGPRLSNNKTLDVGTGEPLQVPSLIGLKFRAPFMHDGCASTLAQRFEPDCGGDAHGEVEGLDASQLQDLIAYLESL